MSTSFYNMRWLSCCQYSIANLRLSNFVRAKEQRAVVITVSAGFDVGGRLQHSVSPVYPRPRIKSAARTAGL